MTRSKLRAACIATALLCATAADAESKTMQDAQSLSVAQSIVDYGTGTRLDWDTVLVMWPQAPGLSALTQEQLAGIQAQLVQDAGTFTDTIAFADSATEAEVWSLLRYTGVTDTEYREQREQFAEKVHYAIIPFITRAEGKYYLTLTFFDVLTGQRKTTQRTSGHSTSAEFCATSGGAVGQAVVLLCDLLKERLSDTDKIALTEGTAGLTPAQQVTIASYYTENAETALDELEYSLKNNPSEEAFYNARIAEQRARLLQAQSQLSLLTGDLAAYEELLAQYADDTPAEAEEEEAPATRKTKDKTKKTGVAPVWEWGKDGMNGIYLDIGYMQSGPDLALAGLFEINNWLSVGGDFGVMLLPGYSHDTDTDKMSFDYENTEWHSGGQFSFPNKYEYTHTSEMPVILSFDALVNGGISIHRFYFYGFAGLGMYILPYSKGTLVGLSIEGGAGVNVRFFSQHFSVGAFYKFRGFPGVGFGSSVGISWGWNF